MFKDDYKTVFSKVTASADTYRRVMDMSKETKKHHIGGLASKLLVAVALISLMTVTASASEVVRSWFVTYFSDGSVESLSQEQVDFIEENEKHLGESKVQSGWTIELRSALTDGMKGYIMLGVTAPENTSLEDIPEKSKSLYYGPGNDFLSKDENCALTCAAYPDSGVIGNISSTWQEDGDGLTNTLNYVIDVTPDVEWAEVDPFASDTGWHIHVENFVYGFPEQTVLAEGIWDFDFTFENQETEIELLAKPVKTLTWATLADGTEIQAEVTMTSVELRPFGVTVYYGDSDDAVDYERTSINFTDSMSGQTPWFAVMKDGSKTELLYADGNPIERYQYLETKLPITLGNVDYLLVADGTKLPMPELETE